MAFVEELLEGLLCGRESEVDAVSDGGFVPCVAGDGGVGFGEVAGGDAAIGWERFGHAEGGDACEDADFEDAGGVEGVDEEDEELGLEGLGHHLRLVGCGGGGFEFGEVGEAWGEEGVEVVVDGGGEVGSFVGHGRSWWGFGPSVGIGGGYGWVGSMILLSIIHNYHYRTLGFSTTLSFGMNQSPRGFDPLRQGFAFLFEDSGGEGVGGIVGEDGAGFLDEDGAVVVAVVGEVDGAAGDLAAVLEDSGVDVVAVHAGPAEGREQGRVDIEDAPLEVVGDLEEAEEASEDDEVSAVLAAGLEDGGGEGAEIGVVLAAELEDGDLLVEVAGLCGLEGFGAGGDDQGEGGVEAAIGDAVGEVLEGTATA